MMKPVIKNDWVLFFLVFCLLLTLAGCGSKTYLMPTPNVYTHPDLNPFADVPPVLQSNKVSVLYVTDRVPTKQTPGHWEYGYERSRSVAFGEAQVQIGDNLSWDALVQAGRSQNRKDKLELKRVFTNELGRFNPTPSARVISDTTLAVPDTEPPTSEAARRFTEELTARLAVTPRKEVFLYVHGFHNTFENSVFTIAELWHFLGREGVPLAYSWPCGEGGAFSYLYTISSGQFTNFHLKRTLRLIADCPAVEKIHIIAHSRGTDGAITAVRDLWLETRGTPGETAKLKLGTCVWAAADIDMEVDEQWNMTERVDGAVEAAAIYISHEDRALAFATWLMGGKMRLGDVKPGFFTKEEMDVLQSSQKVQIIDARTGHHGLIGHNYFHHDPAVSSDLMLFLRYDLPAGGDQGRPLRVHENGFWLLHDKYPGSTWKLPMTQNPDKK